MLATLDNSQAGYIESAVTAPVTRDDGGSGFSRSPGSGDVMRDNDGGQGYVESGSWTQSGLAGVGGGTSRYALNNSATASFTFENLIPGQFNIQVATPPHANSTIAKYTVTSGGQTLGTFTHNQRTSSGDFTTIGSVNLSGTSLTITVSQQDNSGVLRADAVRVSGAGWTVSSLVGEQGDSLYAMRATEWAKYSFTSLTAGRKELFVNTPGHANSTTQAVYTVTSGGQVLATYTLNQQPGTGGWKSLGWFDLSGESVEVTITNGSSGVLRADGVELRDANGWNDSSLGGHLGDSRFSYGPNASAEYALSNVSPGLVDLQVKLFASTNAATHAKYDVMVGTEVIQTLTFDQRTATGDWQSVGNFELVGLDAQTVKIRVSHGAGSTPVLRADAVALFGVNQKPSIDNVPTTPLEVPFGLSNSIGIFDFEASDPDNAVDPDTQQLVFSIVDDPFNSFEISADGILRMKDNIWTEPVDWFNKTRDLVIKVTDSGAPELSDTKSVTVTFVPGAAIYADAMGSEGSDDNIALFFRRFDSVYEGEVELTFELIFLEQEETYLTNVANSILEHASPSYAWPDDVTTDSLDDAVLLDPLPGTGGQQVFVGTVTIADGEIWSNSVTLVPEIDGVEGFQVFAVRLVSGATYVALSETAEETAAQRTSFGTGSSDHVLGIVDDVTLFSPHNPIEAHRDFNAAVEELGGNPGIHPNDVHQAFVPNCFFMAAVAALARQGWPAIERLFENHGDGSYSVALYEPVAETPEGDPVFEWKWVRYTKEELLLKGNLGAVISGDRTEGKFEIWSVLLERRFMDSNWYFQPHYGGTLGSWLALTGVNGEYVETLGMTNEEFVATLASQSGFLIVGTKDTFANGQRSFIANAAGQEIFQNHAYVVEGIQPGVGLSLRNPWGSDNVDPLEIDKIDDVLVQGYWRLTPDYGVGPPPVE